MGCQKSLTISEAITGDMPLQDAVFCPLTSKIYGTMGPYVLKCNASTGARESALRVTSPAYGDCRITYNSSTALLYVSVWNQPNHQWFSPTTQASRDIFPVDPTLMTVGAGLAIYAWQGTDFSQDAFEGPRWVGSLGAFLYYVWKNSSGASIFSRINPAVPTTHSTGTSCLRFNEDQVACDGTDFYLPQPAGLAIRKYLGSNASLDSSCSVSPYHPVGIEWCASTSRLYVVCGDNNLLRIDSFTIPTVTPINLDNGAIISGTLGNSDPVRIRYRIGDHKLYIPCMTAQGVIVYDPAVATGILKTGFENPVDVVFTDVTDGVPVKAFAVQNSVIGLKEIT